MTHALARFLNTLLNGTLRGLLRAWVLILPLLVALSVIRWGQLAYFWPRDFHATPADLTAVAWQGMRFDLKVSAIAAFLLLVLFPWISAAAYRRWALGIAALYVFVGFINLHYFGFYKTPIDSVVFGLFEDDTAAVLQTIWHDFPVVGTLLAVVLTTWLAVRIHRLLVGGLQPDTALHRRSVAMRIAVVVVAFVAILFAGKGTLRQMALQRQHLTVTTSQFLNDMVPNGVIALKYAWDNRRQSQNLSDPLVGLKALGFESPQAAAQALGLPYGSEAEVREALYRHEPLPPGTPRKNLVFFLMESWSAEPMLYQSPTFDVLGRMAPTLDKACHFSNFESAQPGTHPSLEALLFSSPITPLTMGDAGRKPLPWGVAQVAKRAGYDTLFVTSARSGWRDLNRVLKVQGFDEVIDANNLKAEYPDATVGLWGVWDSYVYRYLEKRMAAQAKDRPLFVFVLTATNHPPYDLPADYQRVPLDMSQWKGETSEATLIPNLDTYRYAHDLLGAFVQQVQQGPLKDNTLIAATGDHNVRSFGVYAEPSRRYLMRQVPFVIWAPQLRCGNQRAQPASHRDIFNTLFPLAGIEGPYINAGRNLLKDLPADPDPMNAPRGLFFTGEARNAQGMWQLGNPKSFVCTAAQPPKDCAFNAQDDLQERARYGLLDWNIRTSLPK
jgi:phosphoglycerol transferase MdoB-like AlkP superfamily enzyme